MSEDPDLDLMKLELLACANEVHRITSQQIVPLWKRELDASYYRSRIRELERLIAESKVLT